LQAATAAASRYSHSSALLGLGTIPAVEARKARGCFSDHIYVFGVVKLGAAGRIMKAYEWLGRQGRR
jgi:hypothetical protein